MSWLLEAMVTRHLFKLSLTISHLLSNYGASITKFEKNVREKLRSLTLPSRIIDEFIHDILGHRQGQTMEEGLVDCVSIADFDSKLENLEAVWNGREDPYCGKGGPQFYRYFEQYRAPAQYAKVLHGLGSPPAQYTTNASEEAACSIQGFPLA